MKKIYKNWVMLPDRLKFVIVDAVSITVIVWSIWVVHRSFT